MEKTMEIPEGYEARIEGNKVILERKESEDERIRKELIEFLDELWHLGKNTNFDKWGKADCAHWIAYLERQKEQKPAEWSEEDEKMLNAIIDDIYYNAEGMHEADEKEKWLRERLKSLRPQPHWKPSEEQVKAIDLAIRFVTDDFDEHPTLSETLRGLYNDLKKL